MKWTKCFLMPYMKHETVTKIIVVDFISKLYIPDKYIQNKVGNFQVYCLKNSISCFRQKKTPRTTPYNPKSDSMVERFNKKLLSMQSVFVADALNTGMSILFM